MSERILNEDSNRRGRARMLLALGLAMAMSAVACGEDPPATGKDDDSVSKDEDAEDEDEEQPKSTPKVDAGSKPSSSTSKADAGSTTPVKEQEENTPVKPGSSDSSWCKAKPIIEEYCGGCHGAKVAGGAPMSLVTPADFLADAPVTKGKKVSAVVKTRMHDKAKPMPPRDVLKPDELAAIDAWIDEGAPAGADPTCAGGEKTPEKPVAEAWPPAECDAVYKILSHGTGGEKDPYKVPVGQEIHPQIQVNAPWGNEKVQAIAFKPVTDNIKVLHHWILYAQSGAFLTGWAPGDDERASFPADIGMDMPTGNNSLRLDMHYFNLQGTQTESDNSGLEVCVVKGEHLRKNSAAVTMSFASFGNGLVMAPAGAKMAPITGTCNVTTTAPVHLMTASPHAHTYARHMKFTVKKKDGKEIVMHDQEFKFGEQGSYGLTPDVVLETGDKVMTTCYFTNETSKNITFGESTTNEMCFNFAMYWPKGALSCGGGGLGGLGGS